MKPRLHFVAGLIVFLPAAVAMAAAPRFSGAGDSLNDVPVDAAPVVSAPQVAAANDGPSTQAEDSKTTANADSGKRVDTKSDKPISKEAHTAAAPTSKSESWWSRLFHKHPAHDTKTYTHKKVDSLVNTDIRHKEVYDLLQTTDVQRFEPGYDGRWHVQTSNVMCRMKQKLPSYGYVEFRQGVDQPLEFALYVDHPPAGSGIVQVSSEPPIWRHYVKAKKLGTLDMENGDRAVMASSAWSRRLLIELSEGMQPVLRFWDAADASDDIEVFLSAIQFQESLNLFHRCLGQLLHYDFKQVQANVVHFNPDSSRIRKQSYQQLDDVIETAKLDKDISEVNLKVYTYRSGLERYNFRLATRRAQGVRDYLLKHGIKEDKIFIKIYTKSKVQMRKLGYSDADVYISLQRNKIK